MSAKFPKLKDGWIVLDLGMPIAILEYVYKKLSYSKDQSGIYEYGLDCVDKPIIHSTIFEEGSY